MRKMGEGERVGANVGGKREKKLASGLVKQIPCNISYCLINVTQKCTENKAFLKKKRRWS